MNFRLTLIGSLSWLAGQSCTIVTEGNQRIAYAVSGSRGGDRDAAPAI